MNKSRHAIRAALVCLSISVALMLAGCFTTSPPKPDQATIIKDITISNNQVVLRQIDLALEREKTRQAELTAESVTSTALQNIGITAPDSHSRVVASVALLGAAKTRGGASGGTQPAPTPQIPPQQAILPERDGLDRVLQVASVLMPGGVPAVLTPVLAANTAAKQIAGSVEQARIAGDVTKSQWAAFANAQASAWTATGGMIEVLGRPNQNTWNIGGDYAGGDLIGRYSGAGSGSSGPQLFGSGILNTGNNARFTSPGPYKVSCTTGNVNGTSSPTGGDADCPVQ